MTGVQTCALPISFAKHEKDPKINIKDVQAWKDALKEVGNISGWHVNERYHLFLQNIFVQIIINLTILSFSTL